MWWNKKEENFKKIYIQYKKDVFFTAYRLTHDNEKALEISQEVFLKLYQTDLSRIENLKGWIKKVTYNIGINYLKKFSSAKVVELQDYLGKHEKGYEKVEMESVYQKLFAALTEKERAVFILRFKEDYSYREIAEILDIPQGTVMSRLNSARKKIAHFLKKEEVIDNG